MGRPASRQIEIGFPKRGGRRKRAGRKPNGERAGVSHARRPRLDGRKPALVTMKVRRSVWNLRSRRAFERILGSLSAARSRPSARVVHFSVQRDHLHLIVEAGSAKALCRGIQGLAVRIARALNCMMATRGKVFADRYHAHVLATPRQVRTALRYVLLNARKHGEALARGALDPFSSAASFDGWAGRDAMSIELEVTWAAGSWLLRVGWRRAGPPLEPDEVPGG